MGLARAFLAGGAGAVLASQWPIGPSSAELMGAFYRRLASGDEPAAALRSAQLALRRDPRTARSLHSEYTAGITTNVSTVLVIIPPTIGAAIRFITSAPVPCDQRMGTRPAMMAVTVIIFGRTRSTAPDSTAASTSARSRSVPALWRAS